MNNNEQHIKDAIQEFLKVSGLAGKLAERKILDGWENIVGRMIARHTKDIFIHNKKLFITLDSAPLRQELLYEREKIIQLLNEEAGQTVVEEIVFR